MLSYRAWFAVSCCACLASYRPATAAPTFQTLIDSNFLAPDGQPIGSFVPPQLGSGVMALVSSTLTPNTYLFAVPAAGGTPLVLASTGTKVPGGTGNFTPSNVGPSSAFVPPGCTPPAIGSTSVAFVGRDAAGDEGLYSVPIVGGAVRKLANYKTKIPGGVTDNYTYFNVNYSFCNISISGDTIVFDTNGGGVFSVSANGGKISLIGDGNTPFGTPPNQATGFNQPSISGKTVTYIASSVFGPIYVMAGGTKTLGSGLAQAGTDDNYFYYPVIAGKRIVYSAKLTPPDIGLFSIPSKGGAATEIMDLNSKVPPKTPGDAFVGLRSANGPNGWSLAGDLTLFAAMTEDANGQQYSGIFSACHGKLSKVVAAGDVVNGTAIGPSGGISLLTSTGSGKSGTVQGVFLGLGQDYWNAIYKVTMPGC